MCGVGLGDIWQKERRGKPKGKGKQIDARPVLKGTRESDFKRNQLNQTETAKGGKEW